MSGKSDGFLGISPDNRELYGAWIPDPQASSPRIGVPIVVNPSYVASMARGRQVLVIRV